MRLSRPRRLSCAHRQRHRPISSSCLSLRRRQPIWLPNAQSRTVSCLSAHSPVACPPFTTLTDFPLRIGCHPVYSLVSVVVGKRMNTRLLLERDCKRATTFASCGFRGNFLPIF